MFPSGITSYFIDKGLPDSLQMKEVLFVSRNLFDYSTPFCYFYSLIDCNYG